MKICEGRPRVFVVRVCIDAVSQTTIGILACFWQNQVPICRSCSFSAVPHHPNQYVGRCLTSASFPGIWYSTSPTFLLIKRLLRSHLHCSAVMALLLRGFITPFQVIILMMQMNIKRPNASSLKRQLSYDAVPPVTAYPDPSPGLR